MRMPVALIAAVARNNAIGGGNALLWRIKSDMRHFRSVTMGKPVLMGRKTWDSIGRPLPGRQIVVLTRDATFSHPDVASAANLQDAFAIAQTYAGQSGAGEIIVAGGADLYAQTLPMATRLHITEVDLSPDADAFFPPIDPALWREASRESHAAGPDDEAAFAFVEYARR